jgi:hypothetical protein
MKKILLYFLTGITLFFLGGCDKLSLDLAPDSVVADGNYWKTPEQFETFITGIHSRMRTNEFNFMILGELRSDVFGDNPFTGEATQGMERFWYNTINSQNTGITNYADLYSSINQINLLISKTIPTTGLLDADKNYYLGQAYGLRAFNYFHLLRTWGDAIITTEPSVTFELNALAKAASSVADVMALIKSDIDNSEMYFGSAYSFKFNDKAFWSKAATLMLKAEIYLWDSKQMGGGIASASVARSALTDIQTNIPALGLMTNFKDIFPSSSVSASKNNKEIIFALRNNILDYMMMGGTYAKNFLPQADLIGNFWDSIANAKIDRAVENYYVSQLRAPIRKTTLWSFNNDDSRKLASVKGGYTKDALDVYTLAGCYLVKFPGKLDAGAKKIADDYIVYRYADLLLMLVEAKNILGEDFTTEINLVRARAYGAKYNPAIYGYPNQAIDADNDEAILRERFLEFIGEGKRWYDLRRFGKSYVFKYTTASADYQLLWPIDKTTLTNNRLLVQTPGY